MNSHLALIIGYSIALVVLFFLSFFFSSSDMAYGSVDVLRLHSEQEKNPSKKGLLYARKLTDNYGRTISTILLLNDTVNAGLDAVSTMLGVNLAFLILSSPEQATLQSETWGLIASMICLVIKIIFGEIIAKSFGKIFNFKLSVLYSRIIRIFSYITLPITFVVSSFGDILTKPFLKKVTDVVINEDDLHEMVDDIEEQGMVDKEKATLLHETIRYTHTEAYEIMTPRVDILAIDVEDMDEAKNNPEIYEFSRIPVYENTIDNIIGYVKSKNLMIAKIKNVNPELEDILETPLRVPRSMEINDILKMFRTKKKHFALVMDEYGGVEGILTMEDILEEIVGEIWDESDNKEKPYHQRKDGSYIVDGSLTLEDFCDLFDLDFDDIDTEYVTIGGFIIELLDDHFANLGDICNYKDLTMKILATDKNGAVDKILVTKKESTEDKD